VLLSDIPVLREIYGDTAAYCDPADHRDIADRIAMLMNAPSELARLREAGLAMVRQLSWRRGAEDLLGIIEAALAMG
jgi:glycosyltransferase involved in cell wall biosynthesis